MDKQRAPARPNQGFAQAVELTTATYDQAARDYAERNEGTPPPHLAERMEQFIDLLAEDERRYPLPDLGRPGDDASLDEYLQFVPVLDAGCGSGRDARTLAAHGLPVLAVDLSQGMLDEAMERTARRLPQGFVRYAVMDLRRLELPDRACRGVWCAASLLHLPRKTAPRAVAELARVARREAPLMVELKRREGEIAEEFQPYEFGGQAMPRFFAYYTEAEARTLVEEAGFTVLDLACVADPRPNHPRWVTLLARKAH